MIPIDETNGVTLLITNRHVLKNPNLRTRVVFHKKKLDKNEPSLGDVIAISDKSFEPYYYAHPDPNVDLACLNVSTIFNVKEGVFALPMGMGIDFPHVNDYSTIHAGQEVWFIGYPDGRYDLANNLPILRFGRIASIPEVDFNGETKFLIDAQVFPGSSGSPVLVSVNNKLYFAGVLVESFVRTSPYKQLPVSNNDFRNGRVPGFRACDQEHQGSRVDFWFPKVKNYYLRFPVLANSDSTKTDSIHPNHKCVPHGVG